jgi:hypothetical protein
LTYIKEHEKSCKNMEHENPQKNMKTTLQYSKEMEAH